MQNLLRFFADLWTITEFDSPELREYADEQLLQETRQGLKVISTLLILLILAAMLLFKQLGNIEDSFNLNYFWVMALAAHINISARVVGDIKTLHALGITLLVISATAYVFIAHQSGDFNPLLIANIVLLFMFIPLMPWGLREAIAVVLAIYGLLTLSIWGVKERFNDEILRVIQFFLLSAGVTSLVLVIRSTLIRKQELKAHFDLKKAHAELYALSNIDPLTGAWNRRYTETAIEQLIQRFKNTHSHFFFAVLDLNKFKQLNDQFGHDFGDQVLTLTSQAITDELGKKGFLIRIGGDEFIVLMVGLDPEKFFSRCIQLLHKQITTIHKQAVYGFSWGGIEVALQPVNDVESIYHRADQALYKQKNANRLQRADLG